MGKGDAVTKIFTGIPEVFADAFNFLMFDGEQVINPKDLIEQNTSEVDISKMPAGRIMAAEKLRDLKKMLSVMKDDKASYTLLAIENQTNLHNAMPVKVMRSDSITYDNQLKIKMREHRKAGDSKDSSEYLSGWHKDDELLPVITLVIYFGTDEWDCPKTLHEMMNIRDKRMLKYIPDYRINLISPQAISDKDFAKFHSELGQVLKFIKHSRSRTELSECLAGDPAYDKISECAADVINVITGSKFVKNESEEGIDMGKKPFELIMDEVRNEGIEIGKSEGIEIGKSEGIAIGEAKGIAIGEAKGIAIGEAKGIAIGEAKGIAIGEAKGIAKGESKGFIKAFVSLVKDGLLTISEAAKRSNMTEDEFTALLQAQNP